MNNPKESEAWNQYPHLNTFLSKIFEKTTKTYFSPSTDKQPKHDSKRVTNLN